MVRELGYSVVLGLSVFGLSPLQGAEQDTAQAVIPWEAHGRVFRVDTDQLMYMGALQGIIYVGSADGEINEALILCPVTQTIDETSGVGQAKAHCEIAASGTDIAFAEMACEGSAGDCRGTFTLIGGEGRFEGISGEGSLRVRSPIDLLVTDLSSGAELTVNSGLAIISDLEYRIP